MWYRYHSTRIVLLLVSGLASPVMATGSPAAPPPSPDAAAEPRADNAIPPPPPGPYISTALSETRPRFHGADRQAEVGNGHSPFFTPDMPWPDHRMPHTWMPEGGYRFAPPMQAMPLPEPAYPPGNAGPGSWQPWPMWQPYPYRGGVPAYRSRPPLKPAYRPPSRPRPPAARDTDRKPGARRGPDNRQTHQNRQTPPPAPPGPWLPLPPEPQW